MPATYEPITTTTLASNTTSVTLSSIPQTYTDLVMIIDNFAMNTGGSAARIRLNGDTGALYTNNYFVAHSSSSSLSGGQETNQTSVRIMGAQIGPNTTNQDSAIVHFIEYTGGYGYKTILVRGDIPGQETYALTGHWRSSANITSIELRSYNGTDLIKSGTRISLYGILAATEQYS